MAKRRYQARPTESEGEVIEHVAELRQHSELIEEIKQTADRLAEDGTTRGDLKILSRALRELRYAFKVFTPYRRNRKVTVFGSARTKPEADEWKQAELFGPPPQLCRPTRAGELEGFGPNVGGFWAGERRLHTPRVRSSSCDFFGCHNSPAHTTSVESSSPRCFKSVMSAATGWSVSAQFLLIRLGRSK